MNYKIKKQYALYLSKELVDKIVKKYPAMAGNISGSLNLFLAEKLEEETNKILTKN